MNSIQGITIMSLFLMLFVGASCALSFESKLFEVDVSGDHPIITERFALKFDTILERQTFSYVVARNGSQVSLWQAYNSQIAPQFGSSNRNITNATFTFNQSTGTLELRYELQESLAQKIRDEARAELWSMSGLFRNFEQGNNIVIPSNTTIRLTLKPNAEAVGEWIKLVDVQRNVITITQTNSNNLEVQYKIPKPIAPTFSADFLQTMLSETWFQALMGVIIILGGGAYWKRRTLTKQIQKYI